MRRLFADAMYWIAIANHKDQWHAKSSRHAIARQVTMITTEEVLDEFLTITAATAQFCGTTPLRRWRTRWPIPW